MSWQYDIAIQGRRSPRTVIASAEPGHEAEWALVLSLARYPETLMNAWENRDPAVLCNYLYGAVRAFSRFYHDCRC
jgi:arginyl-tRNA synthetase